MESYLDWISIVSGVIQTVLYCDFFYLYITRGKTITKENQQRFIIIDFSSSWSNNSFTTKCLKTTSINCLFIIIGE